MEENDTKTEWTVDQVVEIVTALVKRRHGIDFDTYFAMIKRDDEDIDSCRDSDIIGLLKLIGIGAEVVAAV